MNKFAPGEKVRLKENFWQIQPDDNLYCNDDMKNNPKYKVLTIKRVNTLNPNWYYVHENSWMWDESWFEYTDSVITISDDELMSVFENE